eukprot:TRINITY_DN21532_c0_g1_i1.p1 TRINITY_DN21532_c0_g1~~TRINITY_DN21532_c0_g1_i1.p1  ORF type:complete len:358 (+),score=33.53 TRINITY_DN21532_c0_g1_i1:64-1137(+)
MALSIRVLVCLAVWISLSAGMIIYNAVLLQTFRHPIWLTCCQQVVCTILICCFRCVRPDLVATGGDADTPPLTFGRALKMGLPVAVAQCVGLAAGNTAVMYASVSFCQMMKALTPACVYVVGCLLGVDVWSTPVAKTIAWISFGLTIASVGEIHFDMYGFGMQLTALIAEGVRINLLELRLKSQGYRLNPLTSILIFAPMVGSILFMCGLALDRSALEWSVLSKIGLVPLAANALLAFFLNIAIYVAIQTASGLVFAFAGIFKDIAIISGSAMFMGTVVSATQLGGYVMAIAGLQAYGSVSKDRDKFAQSGLVRGLYTELRSFISPGADSSDKPLPVVNPAVVGTASLDEDEVESGQ